jgi:hypothetical protein
MNIAGARLGKKELLKHVGNLSQIGGTRHYELSDGRSRGVRAIDFDTGAGLAFTVLPDRALDISRASWKGMSLAYHNSAGETHPAYYDARGLEWLRGFFAGLLTTCGLTNVSAPCEDQGQQLGLHGRLSHTPASRVCDLSGWRDDDTYEMKVSGVLEEAVLFGDKLRLTRTITSTLGAKSLHIEDAVENFGAATSPLCIVYHVNAGFPLLNEGAELVIAARECKCYDTISRTHFDERLRFAGPTRGFRQRNFQYGDLLTRDGYAQVALVNRCLLDGLGLYLRFATAELPWFNEWVQTGEGEYVVGIEPGNVPVDNRRALRERSQLAFIEPGETKRFGLEIGILTGNAELDVFVQHVR